MSPSPTVRHVGQIDAFRAIAVACVIVWHGLATRLAIGPMGVDLFFVISGFLITGQLLMMQQARAARGDGLFAPLRSFFGRRVLRLYPVYIAMLAIAAAANLPGVRHYFGWYLLPIPNVVLAIGQIEAPYTAHLWSLGVEWEFYALWAFAVLLAPRKWLPLLVGMLILLGEADDFGLIPLPEDIEEVSLISSLHLLGGGGLLAIAQDRRWPLAWLRRATAPLLLGAALLLGLGTYYAPLRDGVVPIIGSLLKNVGFVALVHSATGGIGGPAGWLLDRRPLRSLGVISYGAYAYHLPLMGIAEKVGARHPSLAPAGPRNELLEVFVLTVLLATASYWLMERPLGRYRHLFRYPGLAPSPDDEGQLSAAPSRTAPT